MRRVLMLVLVSGVALSAQAPPRISPSRFAAHVRWLASDDLGGRANGTPELERAAGYIRDELRAAGLSGAFGGSFEQPFDADVRLEPPASAVLVVTVSGRRHTFALGRDFHPVSILVRRPERPPPAAVDVPVVFAGYGISAPGLGYDDFAGVDVAGAAVLVLTHEPQEHDARSPFDGLHLTPGAALSQKAHEARGRGARLLIVVEDPSHADDRAIRGAWWDDPQSENLGIPVVRASRDRIVSALPALDLVQTANAIDRTLRPASRRLDAVTVSYVEHRAQFTARLRNIAGVLQGADPALADEALVVGAHYDHVGTGGALSEAPEETGHVHNGADDNASGVAALLEMARAAARRRSRFGRSVIFAAFAGEELGLRGSERYATAPPVPLARTRAMINLDMVGRARGRVLVGAFGPRLAGPPLLSRLRSWTRLDVQDFSRGGYAEDASDVAPFARRGVPAIGFFTGFHADYHRPTDDWPRIDADGGADVADLALRLVEALSRQKASTGR